uniref:uncharacterized protein LOC122610115 n=1 Tax=Erigeron canadensis TaxID=72917 RepID=UPI001CB953A9|nr:uncharacterized protein LOC122610115 [Erigeron canadensis]
MTGVWVSIVKCILKVKVAGTNLVSLFKREVGNGMDIRLWLDPWACNDTLKERFPILFQKDKDKKVCVADGFCWESNKLLGGDINFAPWLRDDTNGEGTSLLQLLDGKQLSGTNDRWIWSRSKDSTFSVKLVKEWLNCDKDYSNRQVFKWCKWVPRKCNIFMWRVGLDRIPTLAALNTRNCRFGSLLCGMCDQHEESVGHLLLECEVAMEFWQKIGDWCKVSPLFFFSTTNLFKAHNVEGLGIKEKSVLKGIVFITCWCIWKARNDLRFANITINVDRIFNDIRSIGFLWYRNRGKHRSIMWNDWCGFNLR